ncbi:MAG: hypothetical protein IJT58_01930 [Synergistaceae bacterium]|nr:hypothetical protein [Synergistaceae bacterium]
MCLTIFGAVGYEIGNILTLKFPCKNSDMWPMTGMGEGWMLALMWLLRMSTH